MTQPHQLDYASDPGLLTRVFALLEQAFPGVSARHAHASALGASWATCSIPFALLDDHKVVAHVGLVPAPLRVDGVDREVGCIHAVATAPNHRGRGLYRQLMRAALAHADAHWETVLLTTSAPELYLPFGFRVVEESWFAAVVPTVAALPSVVSLDLSRAEDRARLFRLLDTRAPVSDRLGVRAARPVFLFDECTTPLLYAPSLDAVLVCEREGNHLRLFDVVGPRVPTLAQILAVLPPPITSVDLYFAPDRVQAEATPRPHRRADLETGSIDTLLMARGPFLPAGAHAMLPRSGRT